MSKSREAVTCNGRAAFYAAMWNDLRQAAMDVGWALGLHGSLNSDMDIMAMPWVEEAIPADDMIQHLINTCFYDDGILEKIGYQKDTTSKPNNRVVYTLSIWADFYLDINVISPNKEKEKIIRDTVKATIDYPIIGHDFPNIYPNYKELKDYCDRHGIKDNDEVEVILIKI